MASGGPAASGPPTGRRSRDILSSAVKNAVRMSQASSSSAVPGLINPELERQFMRRIEESDDFNLVLGTLDKVYKVPLVDAQTFSAGLARICWSRAVDLISGDGPLAEAKAEIARLRKRVTDVNTTALRQMMRAKGRCGKDDDADMYDEDDPELVTFYEPLQHIDPEQRKLILSIVKDKFVQMQEGKVPSGCRSELQAAGAPVFMSPRQDKRALADLEERLREVQEALAEKEDELAEALGKAAALKVEADSVTDRLGAVQRELAEAVQASFKQSEVLKELQHKLEQEAAARAEAGSKLKMAESRLAAAESEARSMSGDLEEKLQALLDLQAREAERAAAQTARPPPPMTRSSGAQTELSGAVAAAKDDKEFKALRRKLDEANAAHEQQAAECRKLQLALDELQRKLREELVVKCRADGIGSKVEQIFADIGLAGIVRGESVFERLYKDAERRFQQRLDMQRNLQAAAREDTGHESPFPQIIVQQIREHHSGQHVDASLNSPPSFSRQSSSDVEVLEQKELDGAMSPRFQPKSDLKVSRVMPRMVKAVEAGRRPPRALRRVIAAAATAEEDVEVIAPPKVAMSPAHPPHPSSFVAGLQSFRSSAEYQLGHLPAAAKLQGGSLLPLQHHVGLSRAPPEHPLRRLLP